ncbi:MAG: glycogen/starch/alpha-glucan family phosphorylase [Bifidobacteriaceae bacterium]|jgi:starch phosphorylase|nr:glycogen/starch/alpha-glucan family phosphorylase [Bifidobacteriaceae bacterium]
MQNERHLVNGDMQLVSPEQIAEEFRANLVHLCGVDLAHAGKYDLYKALSKTIDKYVTERWMQTRRGIQQANSKHRRTVAYLSAEYLLGSRLPAALTATNLEHTVREAMEILGLNFEQILETETEPGLGNGGLGRLAACYLESAATEQINAIGYGIFYEYGIFKQTFDDEGRQIETPDHWLENGSLWSRRAYDRDQIIGYGGYTEKYVEKYDDETEIERVRWIPDWQVKAVPNTYLIAGKATGNVNSLRLWQAKAVHQFDLSKFNVGEYEEAVLSQTKAENISKVLYPDDSTSQGKELRFQQQYFFAAASVRDIIRAMFIQEGMNDLRVMPQRTVFQLNDTHPVIAIPELYRILVDEHKYNKKLAYNIICNCFNYTCHTLLPEALEIWDVDMFKRVLPRHFEIICELDDMFLKTAGKELGSSEKASELSVFTENNYSGGIRMAYLATQVSKKVNGVAALHSELLKRKVFPCFAKYMPNKFINITNGVSPRRFLEISNPILSDLITDTLQSDSWTTDLYQLEELEEHIYDEEFLSDFRDVKTINKERFATYVYNHYDKMLISENAFYDVMIKRLHEYKRQTLKLLHIITLYNRIKDGRVDVKNFTPRTFLFGAKAAPSYFMAKETIRLINSVARVINSDPVANELLHVLFIPNYDVALAEKLIPAADLSEQISLAGLEASGTGNMKLAMNGALTVGTLDGANVEIREKVGDENVYIFGMKVEEVEELKTIGYVPLDYYDSIPELKRAIDSITDGVFDLAKSSNFNEFVHDLLHNDRFMVLADYAEYIKIQDKIDSDYKKPHEWTKKSVLNVARMGYFSSDRAVREYVDKIWKTKPLPIKEPIYAIKDTRVFDR